MPEDDDFDRMLVQRQNLTRAYAQQTYDDNPDDAAQSLYLSENTGVPASTIDGDLENFDRQYRNVLVGDLVQRNVHLQEYIRANPMHAKISNDDWSSMDEASKAVENYNRLNERSWSDLFARGLLRGMAGGGSSTIDALGYLTGNKELRNIATRIDQATESGVPLTPEEQRSISARVGSVLGGLADIAPLLAVPGWMGLAAIGGVMGLQAGSEQEKEAEKAGKPGGGAFAAGFGTGAVAGVLPLHMLGRASTFLGKAAVGGATMAGVGEAQEKVHQFFASQLYDPGASYHFDPQRVIASAVAGGIGGGIVAAFAKADKKPPQGADKRSDEALKEEASEGKDRLNEVRDTVEATKTNERSEAAIRNFLELRASEVGISADALKRIYGDNIPRPGDGKLGDVPGVINGFDHAMASDTPVQVRTSDFVKKVSKEVHKQIEDDLNYTIDGVTVNQGKEAPKAEEGETPYDTVKNAYGLKQLPEIETALQRAVDQAAQPAEAPKARERAEAPGPAGAAVRQRDIEEKVAGGLDVNTKAYETLMGKVRAEQQHDVDVINGKREAEIRRRQTAEWRVAAKEARGEAARDVVNSPRVQLDSFLRFGSLPAGGKVSQRPVIDGKSLTEEQRTALEGADKDILVRDKANRSVLFTLDDLARIFNFPSGEAVFNQLAEDIRMRTENGHGPQQWRDALTDAEVDTRMEQKFGGSLDENVIKELGEDLTHPTIMDRLAEEVVYLGMKVGEAPERVQATIKSMIGADFADRVMKGLKSSTYMLASARAGKKAYEAALAEDWKESYIQKQKQMVSLSYAKEAVALEKQKEQFDKLTKRLSQRSIGEGDQRYNQEYLNFIHVVMRKAGLFVNRSDADLQTEVNASGFKDLEAFWQKKVDDGWDQMYIANELLDSNYKKTVDEMTVQEFRNLADTIKSMNETGRAEQKVIIGSEKMEKLNAIARVRANLDLLPKKEIPDIPTTMSTLRKYVRIGHAMLVQFEALAKRIDGGKGVISDIFRSLARASDDFGQIAVEFNSRLEAMEGWDTMTERIPSGPMRSVNGGPMQSTRETLRMGGANVFANLSNRAKYFKGEAEKAGMPADMFETQWMQWFWKHATEKDVKWIDGLHRAIDDVMRTKLETMERNSMGIPAERIPPTPWKTPWGTFEGGYVPMSWDPMRNKPGVIEKLEDQASNTYYPTTPKRHSQERDPNYFRPIDHTFAGMTGYLKQMMTDIAFQIPIKDAAKVLMSNDVRNSITQHLGPEFNHMFEQALKDYGGIKQGDSRNSTMAGALFETLRINLSAALIGFNPATVMKHFTTALAQSVSEVGFTPFVKAAVTADNRRVLAAVAKEMGKEFARYPLSKIIGRDYANYFLGNKGDSLNDTIAMFRDSELMRSRHQNFNLSGVLDELMTGKMSFTKWISEIGAFPVAFSDMMSAAPTWIAAYKAKQAEMVGQGIDTVANKGLIVDAADAAVRNAHGSIQVTSRPELMRQTGMARWVTSLYSFFNHVYNRQYELAWRSVEAKNKALAGDIKGAMADIPKLVSLSLFYVVIPAVIEEEVSPYTNKDKESFGTKFAKTIGLGVSSSVPIARDVTHHLLGGYDPSLGLFSTGIHAATDLATDFGKKDAFNKNHAGLMLQHSAELAGIATGFPIQAGKMARFLLDYQMGLEHPHGIFFSDSKTRRSFAGGLRYGTAKVPNR